MTEAWETERGYCGLIELQFDNENGTADMRTLHFHSQNWLTATSRTMEEAFQNGDLVGQTVTFFVDSYWTKKKGTRGTAVALTFADKEEEEGEEAGDVAE